MEPYVYSGFYNLAYYYYEIGKLDLAMQNIDKALSLSMNSSDKQQALQFKGFILIMQEDYSQAELLFNRLLKEYGTDCATLSGLGHIANARKDYKTARNYFEQAISSGADIRPEDRTIALLGLGWVNANEHKHREAIAFYQKVLKEEPLQIVALVSLGNAYNWLGEYDQAEKYFKRALEIDANNEYALAELGTVYLNKGDIKKSKELLAESLKINSSTYSCPYEGLGLLYLKQGKSKEAEESFKKAIQINPDIEYRKYNGLAKIYIKEGKFKEAKPLLLKSIENYPQDSEAKELLEQIEKKI
jgi:tetratricopeptide (TPR) repeat protein